MSIKTEIITKSIEDKLLVIDEYEFEDIAAEFINHEKYLKLGQESHHGSTRLIHSFKVAKVTYQVAKYLGLDYRSATRAAFLHDFFFNRNISNEMNFIEKAKFHPEMALINSKKYFNLNEKEADAILNHMYPLTSSKPKSMEGITLSMIDKGIAISDKLFSLYTPAKSLAKKNNLFLWILLIYNKL